MSVSPSGMFALARRTQRSTYHEVIYQGVAVECGTLEVFLRSIGNEPVEVSLMQLSVSVAAGGGETSRLFAVHLTYRGSGKDAPVYYATFLAARLTGLGVSWKLTYPFDERKTTSEASGLSRARQLSDELVQALLAILKVHPSVENVLMPSRFRLPDEYVWGVSSSAAESGVQIRGYHWWTPDGNNKGEEGQV